MVNAAHSTTLADSGMALDIRGVSHVFNLGDSQLPVLEQINLQLAPGESVGLLGPSGCGKSTLLRLVAGLEQLQAGSLLADGEPVPGPHFSRVLMFQDPTLYPLAHGLEQRGPGA